MSEDIFDVGIEARLHQDLGRHGFAQHRFGRGGRLAGDRRRQPERDAAIDHRQGVQQGDTVGRAPFDARRRLRRAPTAACG